MRRLATLTLLLIALTATANATTYYCATATAKDAAGNGIASAVVTVYKGTSSTKATIFSDSSGTPLSNPVTADGSGVYTVCAQAGTYRINTSDGTTNFAGILKLPAGTVSLADMAGACVPATGTNVIQFDTAGVASCAVASGSGTMTTISGPTGITWANATTTPAGSWASQTANKVLRSGDSGGAPAFGALTSADLGNFTLNPDFNAVTIGPTSTDAPGLTVRRNGAAQTSLLVRFDDEANNNLSGIDKAGNFTGRAATALDVPLATSTVTGGGTASKCARFDASHHLIEATGDCASGASAAGATTALDNLASVAINAPLATGAGTAAALTATAPTAAASTTAGAAASLTASNATAGTTNAGAASGGTVTITGGNAAQKTSGNANGGNVVLVPGAGVGTGLTGVVAIGGTASTNPAWAQTASNVLVLKQGDNSAAATKLGVSEELTSGDIRVGGMNTSTGGAGNTILHLRTDSTAGYLSIYGSGGHPSIRFTGTANAENGQDVMLSRNAAGILSVDTSTVNNGAGIIAANAFVSNGNSALASAYTNSTASLTNITGLTTTLTAGRKYFFRMVLFVADSVAGEGVQIDFGGGAATATDFRAHALIYDSALLLSSQSTSLTTAFSVATVTGNAMIEVEGEFVVNAGGTFIPRAAQNSHSTGTLTVNIGSNIRVTDSVFF